MDETVHVKCESSCEDVCVKDEPSCSDVCVAVEHSSPDVCVKEEPSWSQAADSAVTKLYADLTVVKDELVLGPELVQPPPVGAEKGQIQQKKRNETESFQSAFCNYASVIEEKRQHVDIYQCAFCNFTAYTRRALLPHQRAHTYGEDY